MIKKKDFGMLFFAIKMLIGDKAKYWGIMIGLTFASFIVTQQAAIFLGIMDRTYGFISDTPLPNVWVMDPTSQYIDDIKGLKETDLYRVRSDDGIEWAVPLYKGLLQARLRTGLFQTCNVIGIDDATLIGEPPVMLEGRIEDLRMIDNAVIVDQVGAADKLASTGPDGKKIPLQVGDTFELNDNRCIVVGICQVSRTFQSQPVIYLPYNRAITIAPQQRKMLSFVLAHTKPGLDPKAVCRHIQNTTGLAAYTNNELAQLTINYYLKYTGIPLNFGTAVILGFLIGIAIAGQTFYNFTLDNLRYFGTFKAMGAQNPLLVKMIFAQAALAGSIGWGLGVGAASTFGFLLYNTELSFKLPWQMLVASGAAILLISLLAALISIHKVLKLEPAIVFRS
jgi:putative ABC transport system permease protein